MICFGYLGSQPGPSQFFYAFWCAPRGPLRTLRGARHRWRGFHDSSVQSPRCEAFEEIQTSPEPRLSARRVGLAVVRTPARKPRVRKTQPVGSRRRPSRTHGRPPQVRWRRPCARAGFPSPRRPCAAGDGRERVLPRRGRARATARGHARAGRSHRVWVEVAAGFRGADRRAVTPRARIHGGDAEAFEAVARARVASRVRARSRSALRASSSALHRHLGLRRAARCPSRRRAPSALRRSLRVIDTAALMAALRTRTRPSPRLWAARSF